MSLSLESHPREETGVVYVKTKRNMILSVALDKCRLKGLEKCKNFIKYDPNRFSDSLYEYNKF
jgi:hypothetical protein